MAKRKTKRKTRRKNPGCVWSDLHPGCVITFNRPSHGKTKGKAILRASKGRGWVVGVGAARKPTIVTRKQFISAVPGTRRNPAPTHGDIQMVAKALDAKLVTPQGAGANGYHVDTGAETIRAHRPSPTATTVIGSVKPIVPTKGPLANNPKSKRYTITIMMNINGLKTATIKTKKGSFSIQTNQNLPGIHRNHRSRGKITSVLDKYNALKEMAMYTRDYGTARQKAIIRSAC